MYRRCQVILNLYICQISCIYCISAQWYRKRGSKAVPKMWVPLEFCSCAWAVIGTSAALNQLALEMKRETIAEVVCAIPLQFCVVFLRGPLNLLVWHSASQHVALPLLQERRHLSIARVRASTLTLKGTVEVRGPLLRLKVWGCTALEHQIPVYDPVEKTNCILLCPNCFISYMFKQMQS